MNQGENWCHNNKSGHTLTTALQ